MFNCFCFFIFTSFFFLLIVLHCCHSSAASLLTSSQVEIASINDNPIPSLPKVFEAAVADYNRPPHGNPVTDTIEREIRQSAPTLPGDIRCVSDASTATESFCPMVKEHEATPSSSGSENPLTNVQNSSSSIFHQTDTEPTKGANGSSSIDRPVLATSAIRTASKEQSTPTPIPPTTVEAQTEAPFRQLQMKSKTKTKNKNKKNEVVIESDPLVIKIPSGDVLSRFAEIPNAVPHNGIPPLTSVTLKDKVDLKKEERLLRQQEVKESRSERVQSGLKTKASNARSSVPKLEKSENESVEDPDEGSD